MRKFIDIILPSVVFLLLSTEMWAGEPLSANTSEKRRVTLTYGVEWGGSINLYENSYSLYVTDDKTLTEERFSGYSMGIGGLIEAHIGIKYNRTSLSAYSGIKSYHSKVHQLPAGVELISFIGKRFDSGPFILLDGSMGIDRKNNYKNSYSSAAGIGYRIKLTERFGIDYSIAVSYANIHPTTLFDEIYKVTVDFEDMRKAYSNQYGVSISTAFIF